jgi:peptide/nickel transport system ATP-binding protein
VSDAILSVRDLATYFYTEEGTVKAVDGVSFDLHEGETLGIVGESGSGKSVTALSVMNIVDSPGRVESGEVRYRGDDLLQRSEEEIRSIRGADISMVMQDPMTSLNPVFTVGYQISRVIREHESASKADAREQAVSLMREVGIPDAESRYDEYPHQFSGGMRQRILIAMAISCGPDVLILDEPTTALDVTIEAQIFDLIEELQAERNMSVILITHDLGVVAGVCDRVAVFYAGTVVERAPVDDLYENPKHPYTRGLMRSIPRLTTDIDRLSVIEGSVPNPAALPSGCSFHPRCPHATEECTEYDPELREVAPDREVACIHARGYDRTDPTAAPTTDTDRRSDSGDSGDPTPDTVASTDGGDR